MSNKLVKFPGLRVGGPVGMQVTIPYPEELVAGTITVVVLKNNQVELQGNVTHEEVAEAVLKAGIDRLKQWHAEKRRIAAGVVVPASGGLVGTDGLPLPPSS